jgi:biopolymer transport protein TolR
MAASPLVGSVRSRGGRGRPRLMSEINVTPFVDVMLVLLIIFMVTAPLLTSSVDVDLPRTQAAQSRGADEPLVVSVNAQGQVFLADAEITQAVLIERLRAVREGRPDARIYLRGDRMLAYGRIMEVMGALAASGIQGVALVALAPDSASVTPPQAAQPGQPAQAAPADQAQPVPPPALRPAPGGPQNRR